MTSLLECNLVFQGITGVEDQLQDGVKESIEALRKASIEVNSSCV